LANSKSFLSPQIIIALVIIAGVGLMAYFYFSNNPNQPTTATATPVVEQASISLPVVSGGDDSFESPVSPVMNSPIVPEEAPANSPVLEKFAVLVEQGQNLYDAGDYEASLQVFNDAVRVLPDSPVGYDARGTIYAEMGDFELAMADYNQAIEIYPGFAQSYYNRGRLYERLGQHEAALADLRKTVELDGDFDYLAYGLIGTILYNQGQYEPAIEAFDAAIAFNGLYGDTHYFKGEALARLERYEEAITSYQTAIERFPNYADAYRGSGHAFLKINQFDQALEALEQAVTFSPNAPEPYLHLAVVHLALGDDAAAQSELEQGITLAGELPPQVRNAIFQRTLDDLETVANETPDKANSAQALINQIIAAAQ
jgi:tetratricopeptide (TPR) repeat protein